MNLEQIAILKRNRRSGMTNGGWNYDAYPELETLDAGRAITIGAIEGPAVITNIHITQHLMVRGAGWATEEQSIALSRGVLLEIYFDEVATPAVRVPLADFFADGCRGIGEDFSSLFVEKAPGAYNCFIPMPFKHSARVILRNETHYDLMNYSFVEYETLPEWRDDYAYFHATWDRRAFQLNGYTNETFLHIDACGHVIGRAWSVCTDEPFFKEFNFVMEGNNEIRIDGAERPTIDYLGSEDSFAFSWGFRKTHGGLYNGMTYMRTIEPSLLSIYRFLASNAIRFNESLDWRVNWQHEVRQGSEYWDQIDALHTSDRGWVDYATTFYWYQDRVGFDHKPMISLEDRSKLLLHPNPPAASG